MRFVLAIVLVFWAGYSDANPMEWMKNATPNELGIFVGGDEVCGIPTSELKSLVTEVLTRSRIKSNDDFVAAWIYLGVTLKCIKDPNTSSLFVFFVEADFGSHLGSGRFEASVIYDDHDRYNVLGVGSKATILTAAKEMTEDAITDYLKANFDLDSIALHK